MIVYGRQFQELWEAGSGGVKCDPSLASKSSEPQVETDEEAMLIPVNRI